MKTVGQRVKHARKTAELSQIALARAIGMKQPTLSALENDESAGTEFLPEIERETGFRAQWLKTGRGKQRLDDPNPVGEWADGSMVPHFAVSASMGLGVDVSEHLELVRNISLDLNQLRKVASFSAPENLSFITAYGNSMEPTFHDGDVLLIDQGVQDIKFDAVYALERGSELFIKRIQRRPDGSFVMLSDNKLYEPQPIKKAEMHEFRVRGRVVLAWNAKKV